MTVQNPVIVVPGITASVLRDKYPVDHETVWSVLMKSHERIALHPDNLRYERQEPARVVADEIFGIPYTELANELRHNLTRHEDQPTPVYPFAYDWRQPLETSEALLGAFIDEVIERTKLMPHYYKAGYGDDPKVDLVGHSMGGLIIAGYLGRKGPSAKVRKVATIGSPFRGSFEAVLKITTGLADLGTGGTSSREREVARMTPALYYLLPSFTGAVAAPSDLPTSLYKVDTWQPTVLETIEEYVRLHGLNKADRKAQARVVFQKMLNWADTHGSRLESFEPSAAGLGDDDWLSIVGVGEVTRVHLQIRKVGGKPEFYLTSEDRLNKWGDQDPNEAVKTGDGTVPYLGARCSFIPVEKIVCVTDDDFGYWEIADRFLEGQIGLHGALPKMNLVHRLIVSHFTGKEGRGTWGRRAPDLPADTTWNPPIKGLKEEK